MALPRLWHPVTAAFCRPADQEALRGAGLRICWPFRALHIGIVGGLVFVIVWRGLAHDRADCLAVAGEEARRGSRDLICALYLVISGASVSTQRAFAMAVIFFGAVLIDRAALTQRSLAIAMMVIILLAPWSVL